MAEVGHVALGAWGGGRFMRFGEALGEQRLEGLLRPDERIHTVITADAYGAGEADALVGRALRGVPREDFALVGAIGHDVYTGTRAGAKGYPRFTDPSLRAPEAYGDYVRMAAERSLERLGVDRFDVLLLHNPDRTGYTHPAVWEALAAVRDDGLADALGVAPGPANGFTLDLVDCLERFGALIDWAMIILNPLEPWPGRLVLPALREHGVATIARVVDHGGLLWDDVRPGHPFAQHDHRSFRPAGWVEAGQAKLDALRPLADRHGLTLLQLAAQWDLAQAPVRCAVPTLIQEPGAAARPVESKRAELAATPAAVVLSAAEVDAVASAGDNTGCMALKGATPEHVGDPLPDRWALDAQLEALAARWRIDPRRDLVQAA
jgi:aryl-alcohol dehydrogenase-like predicted oxidoreductase